MSNNTKLTELKQLSGIEDFNQLSEANAKKVTKLFELGKIDISHITSLMASNGAFYAQVTDALRLGIKVAEGAKHTQGKALDALIAQIEGADRFYAELSKHVQSDSTIERLSHDRIEIGKQNLTAIEAIKYINTSNTELWKIIAKQSLFALGIAAVSIFGAAAISSRNDDEGAA